MVGDYNAESIETLLNLENENRTLEMILEMNDKNKQQLAVYNNQLETNIEAIERLLNSFPEGKDLVNIEKLKEPEYVNNLLEILLIKFEQDKFEFNSALAKAKEVLNI